MKHSRSWRAREIPPVDHHRSAPGRYVLAGAGLGLLAVALAALIWLGVGCG